jgi:hypothetical protein
MYMHVNYFILTKTTNEIHDKRSSPHSYTYVFVSTVVLRNFMSRVKKISKSTCKYSRFSAGLQLHLADEMFSIGSESHCC